MNFDRHTIHSRHAQQAWRINGRWFARIRPDRADWMVGLKGECLKVIASWMRETGTCRHEK